MILSAAVLNKNNPVGLNCTKFKVSVAYKKSVWMPVFMLKIAKNGETL
jgi:hypothetical protein